MGIKAPDGWVIVEWEDYNGKRIRNTVPRAAYMLNPEMQIRTIKLWNERGRIR